MDEKKSRKSPLRIAEKREKEKKIKKWLKKAGDD